MTVGWGCLDKYLNRPPSFYLNNLFSLILYNNDLFLVFNPDYNVMFIQYECNLYPVILLTLTTVVLNMLPNIISLIVIKCN